MSRRWVESLVCGEGFSPRTLSQDLCSLRCLCRDWRRRMGYGMKMLQAERERVRRAA